MTLTPTTRFESFGAFHIARVNGRRVLAFAFNREDGRQVVGASACFSRKQAFERATKPRKIEPAQTLGETLVRLLKAKGFPVTSETDEVDDLTAVLVEKEVFA